MLERDDDVVVFGEDVGYFGGVFRCTEGLQAKYGAPPGVRHADRRGRHHRHRRSGWAPTGCARSSRSSSPTTCTPALDQLISEAARLRYRSSAEFTAPLDRAHAVRRRHPRRPDAQPEPGEPVHPRVRAEDGAAVEPVRRQGPAHRRDRGRRPGDLPRAEADLQRPVRRPPRAARRAVVEPPARRRARRPLRRSRSAAPPCAGPATTSRCSRTGRWSTSPRRPPTRPASTPRSSTCARCCRSTPTRSSSRCDKTGRCVIVHEATRTSGFGAELSAHGAGALLLPARGADRAGHRLGHAVPARPGVGLLPRPGPRRRRARA